MYRLNITTHIDRLKFYEFLYKDCSIQLNRKYILYKEYYANTVLILESKDSKITQRIGDETFINYDLITKNTFYKGRDVDHNLIIEQYKVGICEFKIHKNTNICRSTINKIIKEYNSPTSAQQPKS